MAVKHMAKIKICGLSRPCDIEAVNAAKPDYIGFVFAESRRRVSPSQAAELKKALSPNIASVGVFVDAPMDDIIALVRDGVIDVIQLHGNESEEYVSEIKSLCGKPVIKAVHMTTAGDAQKWDDSCADFLLLDSKGGGTGKRFDWDLIGVLQKPFFLAGGLHIGNIEAAIAKANPFAVDVSSGVETDGLKDSAKIDALVRKVRSKK
jgi:phosphoribosylanthranilate isomerase